MDQFCQSLRTSRATGLKVYAFTLSTFALTLTPKKQNVILFNTKTSLTIYFSSGSDIGEFHYLRCSKPLMPAFSLQCRFIVSSTHAGTVSTEFEKTNFDSNHSVLMTGEVKARVMHFPSHARTHAREQGLFGPCVHSCVS